MRVVLIIAAILISQASWGDSNWTKYANMWTCPKLDIFYNTDSDYFYLNAADQRIFISGKGCVVLENKETVCFEFTGYEKSLVAMEIPKLGYKASVTFDGHEEQICEYQIPHI